MNIVIRKGRGRWGGGGGRGGVNSLPKRQY